MNIDIRHNSDMLDKPVKGDTKAQTPKIKLAGEIAKFMNEQLCIPTDRLVVKHRL